MVRASDLADTAYMQDHASTGSEDSTDPSHTVDAMQDHVKRLNTILSTVSECFKIVDKACCLLDMNEAGLSLIEAESLEQVHGVSVLELVLPDYHDAYRKGIEAALRGERVTQEFEIQGLRGTRRWMQQVAVAMPPRHGETKNNEVAAFTRDITKMRESVETLKAARDLAEQANTAKSEFLANVSHEIRTPMTAILGFTELLTARKLTDPDRIEDTINTIQANARHLCVIVNDVLDVSKIEAGQMSVENVETSPLKILEEVITALTPMAQAKKLAYGLRLSTAIPESIQTDPTRLRQILHNLIGNAIKFTEAGSVTTELCFVPESELLRFTVTDTGIGMTEAQCDQVRRFQAFTQADSSTTRRFGGSGLGLRICQSLTDLLGGALAIESDFGRGSRITATIATGPVDPDAVVEPDEEGNPTIDRRPVDELPPTLPQAQPLAGLRVLLAEDGPDNQRLISHYITKAGATILACNDGAEACQAINQCSPEQKPDLVLMDMQMPVMDGYEATRTLRQEGFDHPIIALTANAMSGDRRKCVDAGCDEYLTKPVNRKHLIETCALLAAQPDRDAIPIR